MTRREINRFRRVLQAKRADLNRELRRKRMGLVIDISGDTMDRVRSITERELVIRDLDRRSALLRKVEGALQEIEEGTFGRCVRCDREIPIKRLEAVPWSPYCVSCQEAAEARPAQQDGRESQDVREYALAS
jgi:DnaK suppressor protein